MKIFFFYAHQDDEAGTFKLIEDSLIETKNVFFIFATTGLLNNPKNNLRNKESMKVLKKLKVNTNNVIFAGSELNITVNNLIYNLEKFHKFIYKKINKKDKIYVPCWEGGQPDHDALHAILANIANKKKCIKNVFQYPLYNNYKRPFNFFRVLKPLKSNGKVIKKKISFMKRLKYIFLYLHYPSQITSWIGLFPGFFLKTLLNGNQQIQKINFNRIFYKPHKGKLYYEVRKWITWEKMDKLINSFIQSKKLKNK